MTRRHIVSGSTFERDVGYARAVIDGDFVFVSGCTGFDYKTMQIPPGIEAQCAQTLANLGHALGEAGSSLAEVVRILIVVPERDDFRPCWPLLRDAFAQNPPASTMIVAGLFDPRMRIEIEATARLSPPRA